MSYIIGIDGSGSMTKAAIGFKSLKIIKEMEVSEIDFHIVGYDNAKEVYREILNTFTSDLNIDLADIGGICIGSTGIDCEEDVKIVRRMFKELGFNNILVVLNYKVITLAGGNCELSGAIIFCGDSSIAFATDGENSFTSGGWGHLIDDVGSGYYLGINGINRVLKAYDGRKIYTLLEEPIKKHYKIKSASSLLDVVYNERRDKKDIAAIAGDVIELYGQDEGARQIVDDGINGLVEMVEALARKLHKEDLEVVLAGHIFDDYENYRFLFETHMKRVLPLAHVHQPYESPLKGALVIISNIVNIENGVEVK